MKQTVWKCFTAMAVTGLILSGCKVSESTYRKVATDTRVTSEKKAIIAPWVSVYFPISNEVIKGDDIVTVDTMWVAYSYTDSIHTNDTIIQKVIKTIYRTDTVKTEEYSKLLIARRENTQLNADIVIQTALRRQTELEKAKVVDRNRSMWLWIILLAAANIVQIYLRLKNLW